MVLQWLFSFSFIRSQRFRYIVNFYLGKISSSSVSLNPGSELKRNVWIFVLKVGQMHSSGSQNPSLPPQLTCWCVCGLGGTTKQKQNFKNIIVNSAILISWTIYLVTVSAFALLYNRHQLSASRTFICLNGNPAGCGGRSCVLSQHCGREAGQGRQ